MHECFRRAEVCLQARLRRVASIAVHRLHGPLKPFAGTAKPRYFKRRGGCTTKALAPGARRVAPEIDAQADGQAAFAARDIVKPVGRDQGPIVRQALLPSGGNEPAIRQHTVVLLGIARAKRPRRREYTRAGAQGHIRKRRTGRRRRIGIVRVGDPRLQLKAGAPRATVQADGQQVAARAIGILAEACRQIQDTHRASCHLQPGAGG